MATDRLVYRFDGFELDATAHRLTRDGTAIYIADRQMDVLVTLTTQPGQVIDKDTLIERAWRGLAVDDNTLVQAVKRLREVLGPRST